MEGITIATIHIKGDNMKEQRWPGDYQTISQEFSYSRMQEQMGMDNANMSHRNDYIAMGMTPHLNPYQVEELDPSWSTQLDTTGMQPHSREFLERNSTSMRSTRKFEMIDGQMIDYCEGIQFSGTP